MFRHNLSGELWGLMRVYPKPASDALTPNPLRDVDDPRATGNHPILPPAGPAATVAPRRERRAGRQSRLL